MTYISNIVRSEGDPKVLHAGRSSLTAADRMAKALGWFSIGLGLVELFAPHRITHALGMKGQETLVRAYGAREIGHGMLSLSADKHIGVWSRVAGDGLDMATLMTGLRDDNPKRDNVAVAMGLVLGITLLDVIAAQGTASRRLKRGEPRLYHDRSGFPKGVQAAKGIAKDFQRTSRFTAAPKLAPEAAHGAGG